MDVIRIQGRAPLAGSLTVSGAKNSALPIFAATLLTDEPCVIENVPDLSDIRFMAEILEHLGAKVDRIGPNTWGVTAANIGECAPYHLVKKMRASVCLLGPLTGRLRRCQLSLPGGCVIGQRPIDLHLKGLGKLGCAIEIKNGYVHVDASGLRGAPVFLGGRHGSTVTGTANLLMTAVLTPGETRIESAAVEPEVADLTRMLIAMGADITGVGSHTLVIRGVKRLRGVRHRVIPDRIEAGTFLVAGAITGGDLSVLGLEASDLGAFVDKLEETGVVLETVPGGLRVKHREGPRRPVELTTLPHPGFPTDLQAQMCALLALTPGLSVVTERVYPNRFMHVPELQRMGADISIEGSSAIINGRSHLSGAPVMSSDLRASAALILAALAAEGDTWVQRVYHLDRGYEKLDQKLRAVGAKIERMPEADMPSDLNGE